MPVAIYQVDAFSDRPFGGNPACVCLLEEDRPAEWMQAIASEMNLSETAFVWRNAEHFDLRWFTPLAEVELCGHATLATSHVLWESGWLEPGQGAVYQTLSGRLSSSKIDDVIYLDFPSQPPKAIAAPDGLLEALSVTPLYVGSDKTDFMLEVENEQIVRDLAPDFQCLKAVEARGVIVTAASDSDDFDFVSRFFGPAVGVDEDPVTGSAHCSLAPYWAEKLGKPSLRAFQASRRGGYLDIEMNGDRVRIGGSAVTVFKGELHV